LTKLTVNDNLAYLNHELVFTVPMLGIPKDTLSTRDAKLDVDVYFTFGELTGKQLVNHILSKCFVVLATPDASVKVQIDHDIS
jgi:hypothetical protein